jgi:hypothetical protein
MPYGRFTGYKTGLVPRAESDGIAERMRTRGDVEGFVGVVAFEFGG